MNDAQVYAIAGLIARCEWLDAIDAAEDTIHGGDR